MGNSPDPEVLEQAIDDSREQLSFSIEMMRDIDDTALHWVRSSLLVIGLMVPAGVFVFRPSTPAPPTSSLWLAGFGISLMFVSVLIGSFLQANTTLYTGFDPGEIRSIQQRDPNKPEFLLGSLLVLADWIEANDIELSRNSSFLVYQQTAAIFGLLLILLSLGLMSLAFLGANT